ncbi:hypothetical protein DPMN_033232 [Dreissena polymorpha]|uniref:Uncharacterized protein n=1 Tax=Dreissena polymorpha TaxID=45954 RepID=A0A9D4M4G8_DREPO|nr:hypothetical protein DPMN_033232 [Dreissena polymorpha]
MSFPVRETTRDRKRERDRGIERKITDKALPIVENADHRTAFNCAWCQRLFT